MPGDEKILLAVVCLVIGFFLAAIVFCIWEEYYWVEVRGEMGDYICGENVIYSEFLNYSNTDNVINCIQNNPVGKTTYYHSVSVGGEMG